MKRRLMAMGLLLTWALAWGSSALAAEETEVEVTLNGFEIELEHPILAWKGSTMVPVEEFCRSLGGDVQTASWDSSPRRHPVPLGRGRLRCAHGGMV